MWLSYILIVLTACIAIISIFFSKELKKKWKTIIVVLLFIAAVIQGVLNYKQEKELSESKERYNSLYSQNELLLAKNDTLAIKNDSLIMKIDNYQQLLEEQKISVDAIKDFSDIAILDIYGKDPKFKGGLKYNSSLSSLIEKCLYEDNGNVFPLCDSQSISSFNEAIRQFPRFPFSYYCLAKCYKDTGNPKWENYAQKGIQIFKNTTKIAGHNRQHDEALSQLLKMVNSEHNN